MYTFKSLFRKKSNKKGLGLIHPLLSLIFAFVFCITAVLPVMADESEKPADPALETAKSALVFCVQADKTVWSKNADTKMYPAGAVKMMTALIALEHYGDSMEGTYVTVTAAALRNVTGNRIGFKTGEMLTAKDLIAAVIVNGANDAASILAADIAGTPNKFAEMMNEKALSLGMKDTNYTNPTGLHDSAMVTTASDLVILAKYCYYNSTFMELCGVSRYSIPETNQHAERIISNRNYFINVTSTNAYYYSIVNGMSVSYTAQAGYSIIASAQYNGVDYISIVLGGEEIVEVLSEEVVEIDETTGEKTVVTPAVTFNRIAGYTDAKKLFQYAIRNYSFRKVIDVSTIVCEIPVRLGTNIDHVTLLPEHSIDLYLPNNEKTSDVVSYSWVLSSDSLTAPVEMGQKAGVLTVYYNGKELSKVDLVAKNNVERSEWLYILDSFRRITKTPLFRITLLVIAALIIIYFVKTAIEKKRRREQALREFNKKYRS